MGRDGIVVKIAETAECASLGVVSWRTDQRVCNPATLQQLADSAWTSLDSDLRGAQQRALAVLDAFVALCRESGAARIGLSGTHGIQCQRSPATLTTATA